MTVTDRPNELRYEIEVDGEVAGFLMYRREPDLADLVHTDVAPKWEGKGAARRSSRAHSTTFVRGD